MYFVIVFINYIMLFILWINFCWKYYCELSNILIFKIFIFKMFKVFFCFIKVVILSIFFFFVLICSLFFYCIMDNFLNFWVFEGVENNCSILIYLFER